MISTPADNWSLCIGRWRGIDVRLHVMFPLLALALLLAVQTGSLNSALATWAIVVLLLSVALHELVRVVTATRVGGHATSIVLAPVGGWTKLHLPVDPPAHLATALAGPMTYFVVMVAAGCGLSLTENREVLELLIHPCDPGITVGTSLVYVGQLVVWINWCLLVVSLLPMDPCAGAELLRGVLWPVVGRATATSATSHVALGAAVLTALFAVVLAQQPEELAAAIDRPAEDILAVQQQAADRTLMREHPQAWPGLAPTWLPFAVVSVALLYGSIRNSHQRRYDVGLAIDEFDSDDDVWLTDEWDDDDREAVLVEHLQDKQQDALDRKRREREANEDARVDAILERLRDTSFEQLSEEERAILKRASRRYRQRHSQDEQ